MQAKNGTFLIRSTPRPQPDANNPNLEHRYSLDILYMDSVKHVRIYYDRTVNKYGFAAPFEFSNLVEMVEYYSQNSLVQHNPGLDTRLFYPIYYKPT